MAFETQGGDKGLFTPQVGSIMGLSFQKLIKTRNLNSGQLQGTVSSSVLTE